MGYMHWSRIEIENHHDMTCRSPSDIGRCSQTDEKQETSGLYRQAIAIDMERKPERQPSRNETKPNERIRKTQNGQYAPVKQALRTRTVQLFSETKSFTLHTFRLSRTFIPLSRLLSNDEAITEEQLSTALDNVFSELYEHPLIRHSRKLTLYLRQNNLIPNEKTTEKLIEYVVDQVLLRSPISVPDVVVREFWIFFHELFSEPELKGLMELNLDILRLLLRTYEPLIVEIINLLKEMRRTTKAKFKVLLTKVRVIRSDLVIIKRQIKAIRYVKPFFQTDPKDFRAQARIVAKMVQEFGPLFVKMAQVAAANSDFLPEEISKELAVFQEDVPPMSPEEVMEAFHEAFGRSPRDCYFGFDPRHPIKSGSIGSVFLAKKPVVHNGKEVLVPVILKIGRQRLDREFLMGKTALNLTILSSHYWAPHSKLAPFLEAMQQQVDEFINGFQQELDFLSEARIQERFHRRSQESTAWRVPRVYTATPRIIEMEYIPGAESVVKTIARMPGKKRKSYAREIAARLLYTVLLHIIVYREFHGDLHPGNLLVNHVGELFMIDWGNCVAMEGKWKPFWDYLLGALSADADLLTEALINISSEPEHTRQRRGEIRDLLEQTLDRKNIKTLKWYFPVQIVEEGKQGLHRRIQVVMHLMSNTQHLGLVVKSEYLHMLRSIVAVIGTYVRLYEQLPKFLIPVDIFKSMALFPANFLLDRVAVGRGILYRDIVQRLPLPEILKGKTEMPIPPPILPLERSAATSIALQGGDDGW